VKCLICAPCLLELDLPELGLEIGGGVGKKKERETEKREEKKYGIPSKKERWNENRKNKLSFFRNCDSPFILTILLLNNKNKK
jgi:hypothetical protein